MNILRNTTFIFDGVKSEDMGVHIIKMSDGFFEQAITGNKELIEDYSSRRRNPYHFGVQSRPIEFTLTFSTLQEKMTPERKYEIMRWLIKDEYATFQTTDDLGKSIDIIAINQVEFMNNGIDQGYFEIEFRASSNHWWTNLFVDTFDLSENEGTEIIEIQNKSNVGKYFHPELEIELIDDETEIEIQNLSDDSRIFKFEDLEEKEKIYINNELRYINTNSLAFPYRLDNFNKNWLRLVYGVNLLKVKGKCKLKFRYRFPIYR